MTSDTYATPSAAISPSTDTRHGGFSDWLLAQRVTAAQQQCVHQRVAHHLSWRQIELPATTTPTAATWCYLQRLRRDGLDDTGMVMAWAALQLYLDYLTDSPPAPSRRAGHSTQRCSPDRRVGA